MNRFKRAFCTAFILLGLFFLGFRAMAEGSLYANVSEPYSVLMVANNPYNLPHGLYPIDEQQRREQVEQYKNMYESLEGYDPATSAWALEMGRVLGVSPLTVLTDPKGVEEALRKPNPGYWAWMMDNRPVTAQYAADPARFAAARAILDEKQAKGVMADFGPLLDILLKLVFPVLVVAMAGIAAPLILRFLLVKKAINKTAALVLAILNAVFATYIVYVIGIRLNSLYILIGTAAVSYQLLTVENRKASEVEKTDISVSDN